MQETELRLNDLFVLILRKWRAALSVGIVLALLLGIGAVVGRVIALQIPKQLERMQVEYEAKYEKYWSAINTVDREIKNNESYISQAESALKSLDRKKASYELAIKDIEDSIVSYGQQITDMEKKIESLKGQKESAEYRLKYRMEQNENSLFMAIDPYHVKVAETFIRVNSGYQVLPNAVYQNPDPTEELLQTYCLLVANADFYETMIADLGIETEVRYLTEVITVEIYNTNSLRIKVIGSDEELVQKMGEYICQAILNNRSTVAGSVAGHTLNVYSKRNYSMVDMEMYTNQQLNMQEAVDLEEVIRTLDSDIFNVQAMIRQFRADMRQFETDIDTMETNIANLPVEETSLNNSIAECKKTIGQLQIQRLDLLEEDEPEAPGITLVGGLIRFVKYAVIGGVVGVILAAAWFVLIAVARGKVLSSRQVRGSFGVATFGVWPVEEEQKRRLAFVDRWVDRIVGGQKGNADLVCANIGAAISENQHILVCGGAEEQRIALVAAGLQEKYAGLKVMVAGSYMNDPQTVEGLAECDGIILVEQAYRSDLYTIAQLQERAKTMDKPVLGVVLA